MDYPDTYGIEEKRNSGFALLKNIKIKTIIIITIISILLIVFYSVATKQPINKYIVFGILGGMFILIILKESVSTISSVDINEARAVAYKEMKNEQFHGALPEGKLYISRKGKPIKIEPPIWRIGAYIATNSGRKLWYYVKVNKSTGEFEGYSEMPEGIVGDEKGTEFYVGGVGVGEQP